ncbi:MAG: 4-alpha-glucanotransferase [Chitinivibrionales bacterium]
MSIFDHYQTDIIQQALNLLGTKRLVLAIHDSSFPSHPDEDTGRGSPYSHGGEQLITFVHCLGFNGIQLGPQGKTSRSDNSPYSGTIFTKNPMSIAPKTLANDSDWGPIVPEHILGPRDNFKQPSTNLHRVNFAQARQATGAFLDNVLRHFDDICRKHTDVGQAYRRFVHSHADPSINWFERDTIFEILSATYGTDDWRMWSAIDRNLYNHHKDKQAVAASRVKFLLRSSPEQVQRYAIGQFLLHIQHQNMRKLTESLGMVIYGDLQVGHSFQDLWAWRDAFLDDYLMGAPPSRTNPEGQPWGYPVLDPAKFKTTGHDRRTRPGLSLLLMAARIDKMLNDYDGIRIDHPHGIVCPWVYNANIEDPFKAVQNGARLYSSPDLPDHQRIAQFSIVSPEQINHSVARYADEWIDTISEEQVERYAILLDTILDRAFAHGRIRSDILCEVLSTWPRPLKEVMTRRGLGRFCVTQKADPDNPHDIYRSENTEPQDWIMVGNHDTNPLWLIVQQQMGSRWMVKRAALLAKRLVPSDAQRGPFVEALMSNPRLFCQAMFAELFLGPARNVSIFFADLFGCSDIYNRPGTVDEVNWTLRIPPDFKQIYAERVQKGDALDLRLAVAMALQRRAEELGERATKLARMLTSDADLDILRMVSAA